jgi:hypothetical protein
MPDTIRSGGATTGGVIGYPLAWVYDEVAYLGTRVHWSLTELLSLAHGERARWINALRHLEGGDR